jgi:hypothetical protein
MPAAEVHEHAAGLTWTEANAMARSWHALRADGRVWLVDPVDAPGVADRAAALGPIAGVLQLLDRHERDGAALAARFEVPLHRLPAALPGTPFEAFKVVDKPKWREVGLWWAATRTLVVPETVGTGPAFAVGDGPVGVHPMLRLFGAGRLRRWEPELLLVGHGPPATGAREPLRVALDRSRGDVPKLLRKLPALVRS